MISGGSDTSYRKQSVVGRRMFILSAAKIVVFGGIIAQLFSLQINQNKKYLTLSDKNRLREWKLPPIRGDFQDFFGNIIDDGKESYVSFHSNFSQIRLVKIVLFENVN